MSREISTRRSGILSAIAFSARENKGVCKDGPDDDAANLLINTSASFESWRLVDGHWSVENWEAVDSCCILPAMALSVLENKAMFKDEPNDGGATGKLLVDTRDSFWSSWPVDSRWRVENWESVESWGLVDSKRWVENSESGDSCRLVENYQVDDYC
jgi:hypothetical protein